VKTALLIVCMLLILALGVFGVGLLLPATREGRAETVIAAPPDRVLAVIADVESQPDWRAGLASVRRDGAGWTETTERGEVIRFTPERIDTSQVVLRLESTAGYSGTWEAVLTPEAQGTRIAVVERATVPSPLGRIMARLLFDPEAFATTYLAALKARSEAEGS
jgi:uncharacterized protein YndB with AHSA1/START domain